LGRSDRSSLRQPVELRAAGGVRPKNGEGPAGVRCGGAWMRDADRRGKPDTALLRRSGCAARGSGIEELDYARGGAGDAVLPATGLAPGCDSRADTAVERLPAPDQPDARRNAAALKTGDIGRAAFGPTPRRAGPKERYQSSYFGSKWAISASP